MIAIKLSGQIEKVVKSMNRSLEDVNMIRRNTATQLLTFDAIKEPSSSTYSGIESQPSTVPESKKRALVDLLLLRNRCKEEVELVKQEMHRLEDFYESQIKILNELQLQQEDSTTGKGFSYLIHRKRAEIYAELLSLANSWKGFYTLQHINIDTLKSYVKHEGTKPCQVDVQGNDEAYSFSTKQSPCSDNESNYSDSDEFEI